MSAGGLGPASSATTERGLQVVCPYCATPTSLESVGGVLVCWCCSKSVVPRARAAGSAGPLGTQVPRPARNVEVPASRGRSVSFLKLVDAVVAAGRSLFRKDNSSHALHVGEAFHRR